MKNILKTGLFLSIFAFFLFATAFAEVSIVPSDTITLKPFQALKEVLERPDNKTPEAGSDTRPKDNAAAQLPDNKTGKTGGNLKEEFERFNKGK